MLERFRHKVKSLCDQVMGTNWRNRNAQAQVRSAASCQGIYSLPLTDKHDSSKPVSMSPNYFRSDEPWSSYELANPQLLVAGERLRDKLIKGVERDF